MGLFSTFVDRVVAKKMQDVTVRAERAGKIGVEVARKLVPVRTGRLKRSIAFTWNQSTLTLTLMATEPYGFWVERRRPFLRPGAAAMSAAFRGGTANIQFDTLPEKYHGRARLITGNSKRTIIGNRKRR